MQYHVEKPTDGLVQTTFRNAGTSAGCRSFVRMQTFKDYRFYRQEPNLWHTVCKSHWLHVQHLIKLIGRRRGGNMKKSGNILGFSLVELLLVLAVIGILSGIAIPTYLGQRRRARVIGDAMSNAQAMRMLLESRKAENGIYGPASGSYSWTSGTPSNSTFLPQFTPKGNTKMNYALTIGSQGLTYTLTVTDPSLGTGVVAYKTDQTGAQLARLE